MKFLIDNNLSFKLVQPLQKLFPGTTHIREYVGVNAGDHDSWKFAKNNGFVILTKDNDFDETSQLEGCPPKIVHLICGNKTTPHILNLIISHTEDIKQFADADLENCLLKIS